MVDEDILKKHKVISSIPRRQAVIERRGRRKPTLAFLDKSTHTKTINGERVKDCPKWNWEKWKRPSLQMKRRMIALTIMETVRTILTNHLYTFNGTLFRQISGGPIGDDITRISAALVMFTFIEGYKTKLIQLSLYDSIRMLKVYVDDLNQVGKCLPYGTQYHNGKLFLPGEGGG